MSRKTLLPAAHFLQCSCQFEAPHVRQRMYEVLIFLFCYQILKAINEVVKYFTQDLVFNFYVYYIFG